VTNVEVTGEPVPRFSRREMGAYTRKVLLALEKMDRIPEEISELSIAIVNDEAMIDLNRRFRRKAKTTDVLTFPADDSYNDPTQNSGRPLGDIVISVDQARRQAADEKHSVGTEVRYLILHGILHALGYDHETDKGEMNALEMEARALVGLS
jgi:probable rRNA maturation factor